MNIFFKLTFITVAVSTLLLACDGPETGVPKPEDQAVAYIKARHDFADAMGVAIAKEQGPVYRLVAISGPQYPVGSALDPANPADVVTTACIVPEPPFVSWVPFPSISRHRTISFGASLPQLLSSASSLLANLGIDVGATSSANWRMEDVAQRLSPQTVFDKAISSGDCAEQTVDRDILFVRGVVYAKETFTSTSGFNVSASTSEMGGGFRVSVDQSGGFKVEDAQAIPRFHIVTLKIAAASSDRSSGLPPPDLIAPSQDTLDRLASIQ